MSNIEVITILEECKKMSDLIKSIKSTRVLICGNSKAVDNVKSMINSHKEEFSEYEIKYYISEKFECNDEEVYLIPYEDRTKCLFDYMEKDPDKENENNV